MDFRYVIADVFTDTPLAGNQLAVFTDARLVPEKLLQAIAREMNFSETVFVYPAVKGGHARIRIFTPFNELPFAGHPTESHHVMARVAHFQELEKKYIPGTEERIKGSHGFDETRSH